MRSEMMDIVAERPVKPTGSSAEFFRTFDSGIGKSWTVSVDLIGGASRDRTDDLIVANDALSQLSYSPTRDS